MALACQKNSYLKELTTSVKSCTPAELKVNTNGKKEVLKGFEVILADTVLFPEGGGQPDDRGTTHVRGNFAADLVAAVIPVSHKSFHVSVGNESLMSFANSVDLDEKAAIGAISSGSALFVMFLFSLTNPRIFMINGVSVYSITRRGQEAVNFVTQEIPVGKEVKLEVDWTRRFDHMQQHSGQHLITAMAESMFGCATTTWNLGAKTSFIELDTPKMTQEEMSRLEFALNEKIREGVAVTPTLYTDKNDPELAKARCRGLPDDHEGPVRVLSIEGIDSCLCCGTHVSNTSDLQMIKLLSVEKGKRKDSVNLNFVCGRRVLEYLGRCLEVEKSLNVLLKGPLEQHYELAEKSVKGFKTNQKTVQTLLREVAVLEAEKFKSQTTRPPFFIYHKKEGSMDFLNMLLKELNDETVLTLLTGGEDAGPGVVIISGPEILVKDVGPKVMELLEGKGGYSKGRFQGKATKLANGCRTKAAQLIMDCVKGGAPEA